MKKQKKYQVAKEYFKKSAKEGNNQSMFEYAKMLLIEEKGNQKIDQVIYFLKTAIKNGNQKASIFLDVYNQIKSVPGFNNLPSETKKFIVSKSVFALLLFDISKIIKIHQKFIKYFSKISEYF